MSRHDDLISAIGKSTIFCSNLGFGEQGAVLNEIKKGIYICPNIEKARNMKSQLDALKCKNVLIDDFSRPFTISKFQSNESKIDLIKTIYSLCFSSPIIISTTNILFSFLPNLQSFKDNVLNFRAIFMKIYKYTSMIRIKMGYYTSINFITMFFYNRFYVFYLFWWIFTPWWHLGYI